MKCEYRVIFGDTDQMGVVYYANYLRMFEAARAEYWRSLGRSYKDLEDPKYKGLIQLSEPIGPSPGSRWAAYAWRAYGDDHLAKFLS